MHKNRFWLNFLALFSVFLFWYTGDALWKVWNYQSLTGLTKPSEIHFTVVEEPIDKYFINASYTIDVNGHSYNGETLFRPPMFRNVLAAQKTIPALESKEWRVWYSQKNPEYSSLQKSYPFKECLYAALLWVLLVYFLWLGWRVKNECSLS